MNKAKVLWQKSAKQKSDLQKFDANLIKIAIHLFINSLTIQAKGFYAAKYFKIVGGTALDIVAPIVKGKICGLKQSFDNTTFENVRFN